MNTNRLSKRSMLIGSLALALTASTATAARASDADAIRASLDHILAQNELIDAATGGAHSEQLAAARAVTLSLDDGTVAELAIARAAMTKLSVATDRLVQSLEQRQARLAQSRRVPRTLGNDPELPEAEYFTDSLCTGEGNDTGDMKIAFNVMMAARSALAAAEFACEQTISGFNAASACIGLAIALDIGDQVLENYNFCDDDVDSAELHASYERLEHIHTDMDYAAKIQLQNDLGQSKNHAAEYMLPKALGGKIEVVQEIVREVMDRMIAAGEEIGNAEQRFVLGSTYLDQGEYKRAYGEFGNAYRQAVLGIR